MKFCFGQNSNLPLPNLCPWCCILQNTPPLHVNHGILTYFYLTDMAKGHGISQIRLLCVYIHIYRHTHTHTHTYRYTSHTAICLSIYLHTHTYFCFPSMHDRFLSLAMKRKVVIWRRAYRENYMAGNCQWPLENRNLGPTVFRNWMLLGRESWTPETNIDQTTLQKTAVLLIPEPEDPAMSF
jgi:hypothetical protein